MQAACSVHDPAHAAGARPVGDHADVGDHGLFDRPVCWVIAQEVAGARRGLRYCHTPDIWAKRHRQIAKMPG